MQSLDDAPTLSPHLFWIWRAFTELNYRRGAGFSGPLPITYSDIQAYCSLKGIDTLHERERLLRFLDVLDREWMRAQHEASEKERASGSTDGAPPSRPARPAQNRRKPAKA